MNDEQVPALRQAVESMATMREAYDNLSQAAEAYNAGKAELVANITAKGVEASASETLPELAEKVASISQETYEINGGEMYAKQLFGVANNDIVPGYWNLYEVMTQLLSDGRLVNYGGILLAEMYKGYDSLALEGAGAGGAYVVSDKDSDGNFIMYTADTMHMWATEDDERGDRWVAYCFANAGHNFEITNTNTSPRKIFIGRNIGNIELSAASRTSEVVLFNGATMGDYVSNGYASDWNRDCVLRVQNVKPIFTKMNVIRTLYLKADTWGNGTILFSQYDVTDTTLSSIIISCKHFICGDRDTGLIPHNTNINSLSTLIIDGVEDCYGIFVISRYTGYGAYMQNMTRLSNICITNTEQFSLALTYATTTQAPNLKHIYFGYKDGEGGNDKTKAVGIGGVGAGANVPIVDAEVKEGWCKPLSISALGNLTEVNMYAHILQRLKQDEPDCGDGVTITLGSTNLAKLTSEESQELLALLRGTYGYTFA